jgi:hypothetical protein
MNFASDLSLFFAIPWAILSFLGGWWFYRNVAWIKELSASLRIALQVVRSLVIFLLGLLLFGIIFETVNYRTEKPIIVALVDHSHSMLNYSDSNSITNTLTKFRNALYTDLGSEYDIVEMHVGDKAGYGRKKGFSDPLSDHQSGFARIQTDFYNRNVGGVIFISDGNFNKGSNPIYTAEKINLTPVFTLGVGDTTPKRDHYIRNVAANDITFYKNKFPVEVDIEGIKMGKQGATVTLSQDGKVIGSQKIQYKDGRRDFEHVSFLVEANRIGFQTYTVSVSKAPNEHNYKNNSRVFYIEVIDARNKVVLLTGAPHPDIAAMKDVLDQDENIEVISTLLKDWNKELTNVDLVIWHEPGNGFDAGLHDRLVAAKIPVFYILGPNTSAGIANKLNAGFQSGGGAQTEEVQGTISKQFNQFELSDETRKAVTYFPPLNSKFGSINVSGGIETFMYQRVGNIQKNDPLLFFGKRSDTKFGVLYGEGLWRWKVNDYVRTSSFNAFSEVMQKTMQYLVLKQNNSPLRITFPKRFTKNEDVVVNAGFYNESMEPITTPVIQLEVKTEGGKLFKQQFAVAGTGYLASLGKMKPGKYAWKAFTKYKGKTFLKSGVFVVEDIELEALDTYANHGILQQMSKQTNGEFQEFRNFKRILKTIKNRDDITSLSIKEAAFNGLIDYKLLFFLLFLLLAVEWFLRKWSGAY